MNKLNTLTITEALDLLKQKKLSLEELYGELFAEVKEKNGELNVYLHLNEDALRIAGERSQLPLAGLPIALKDNVLTKGMPTTASSKVLEKYQPQYSATITRRLEKAGGVILGKTNMDAWAHGSSTETSDFGTTRNPRNTDYLPGGSSGGSAAAVAANLCMAAVGTETAGSTRLPAAWCGVVGLKPTYGRVSRYGIVAMGSSLDSPGPITKNVSDAALLLEYMAGKDKYDATTSDDAVKTYSKNIAQGIKGAKIGYLYHDLDGIDPTVIAAFETQVEKFEQLGAHVEKAPALDPKYAISTYTIAQRAEVSSNLGRYDGIRYGRDRSYFGDEAKRRVLLGTHTLRSGYADRYYQTAQKVRRLFIQDFEKLFQKYDLLVGLSAPGYAPKLGASEGAAMFGELADKLEEPSSLSGLPGINVPCHRDPKTNLYLGMNIVAPKWEEEKMLQAAYAYEQIADIT